MPATQAIHKALRDELGVDTRIGATFGTVYCGVVGGIRRHEFSVMGAPVNLAARLMESKGNNGILVDESVRALCSGSFVFRNLPSVTAKGYDRPVEIAEPLHKVSAKRKKGPAFPFVGRQEEKSEIFLRAMKVLDDAASNAVVIGLMGEAGTFHCRTLSRHNSTSCIPTNILICDSGMGKTRLMTQLLSDVKIEGLKRNKKVFAARSSSTESEQRIPFSAFRKVFLTSIHELCIHDGTISFSDNKMEPNNQTTPRREFSGSVIMNSEESKLRRSLSVKKPQRPLLLEQRSQRTNTMGTPLPKPRMLRAVTLGRLSSKRQFRNSATSPIPQPNGLTTRAQSARHSLQLEKEVPPPGKANRTQSARVSHLLERGDSFGSSGSQQKNTVIPYLSKLCWVCEQLDYPHEYADLVGSQFLGLDSATPVSHVNGHVPLVAELVEFVAQAFMLITNYSDLVLLVFDDHVDSFTLKTIRALAQSGKKMLLVLATRSTDKQAMRRMSAAVNFHVEITLGPLYLPDIRDLLCRNLGYSEEAIDDFFCTEIYQKTGGLPVYLVELLEDIKRNKTVTLGEEGVLRFVSGSHKGEVSDDCHGRLS